MVEPLASMLQLKIAGITERMNREFDKCVEKVSQLLRLE